MKWVLIQRSITTAFGFLALFASCIVSGEELYFVHTDHLGTPQVVTDASQTTVWEGRQTPFGETEIITNQIEMNVRFPGQYYDQESGLSYNYFRDYDPSTGRYVQSDPIGLDGGSNTYGYVYQNPFIYSDPTGEVGQLILAGAVILITTNAANAPTSQMESDALQDATALGVLGASIDNFPGCKIGSSIKNGIKESVTKSAKNASGNLDDAARAARTQPHNTENLTQHARERMVTRNVSSERVTEAVNRGNIKSKPGSPVVQRNLSASESASGRGISVRQDVRTNNVVTVVDKGSKR